MNKNWTFKKESLILRVLSLSTGSLSREPHICPCSTSKKTQFCQGTRRDPFHRTAGHNGKSCQGFCAVIHRIVLKGVLLQDAMPGNTTLLLGGIASSVKEMTETSSSLHESSCVYDQSEFLFAKVRPHSNPQKFPRISKSQLFGVYIWKASLQQKHVKYEGSPKHVDPQFSNLPHLRSSGADHGQLPFKQGPADRNVVGISPWLTKMETRL